MIFGQKVHKNTLLDDSSEGESDVVKEAALQGVLERAYASYLLKHSPELSVFFSRGQLVCLHELAYLESDLLTIEQVNCVGCMVYPYIFYYFYRTRGPERVCFASSMYSRQCE
jgi:hypothetical protein